MPFINLKNLAGLALIVTAWGMSTDSVYTMTKSAISGAGGSIGSAVAVGISLAILPLVSGIWLLYAMPDEESLAGATVGRPRSGPTA